MSAIAIGIACTGIPTTAHAFCRTRASASTTTGTAAEDCSTTGPPLFWRSACVGYMINKAGTKSVPFEEVKRVVDGAFAAWVAASKCDTDLAPAITTPNLGTAVCGEIGFNGVGLTGQNLIVFRDDKWPYSDPKLTLGLTTVTYNLTTGEIFDADIEINGSNGNLSTADPVPANSVDLASVVTHEIGHFFGLAHSTEATATMFATYDTKTSETRSLSADDAAGLCAIYPSSKFRGVEITGATLLGTTACDAKSPESTECKGSDGDGISKGCACSSTLMSSAPPTAALLAIMVAMLGYAARRRR